MLLSTPNARDWKNSPGRNYNAGSLPREVKDLPLVQAGTTAHTDWGVYEPAVRRQEQLTRPAPAATVLSSRGNPRINPAFSEWMMGLPEGWVTEVPGLSYKEQLHAIGNGVCPQQAAQALRRLLSSPDGELPGPGGGVVLQLDPEPRRDGALPHDDHRGAAAGADHGGTG